MDILFLPRVIFAGLVLNDEGFVDASRKDRSPSIPALWLNVSIKCTLNIKHFKADLSNMYLKTEAQFVFVIDFYDSSLVCCYCT